MKENLLLFGCFLAGILLGNFDAAPQWMLIPQLPSLLLMLLILQVGLGLGADAGLRDTIRSLRPSMALFPLFTICGTLLFAALGALVLLATGSALTLLRRKNHTTVADEEE